MVMKCLRRAKKKNRDFLQGLCSFEQVKEEMLAFIFKMQNYPKFINDFVESHMKKIKPLYKTTKFSFNTFLEFAALASTVLALPVDGSTTPATAESIILPNDSFEIVLLFASAKASAFESSTRIK